MQMTKPLIKVHRSNTILYCRCWQETMIFYKQQMGLPVVYENDWFVEFELTDSSFLSIANAARATIQAVDGQGITLTWQVTNIEQMHQQLMSRAIETTPIRDKWGARVFYCYDPEGHRLEFWANEDGTGDSLNE